MKERSVHSYSTGLYIEQIKLIYANAVPSTISILVVTFLCWIALDHQVPAGLLDSWAGYMLLVALTRILLYFRFNAAFDESRIALWSGLMIASAAFAGVGWAGVGFFAHLVDDTTYRIIIVMIVLGIMAASVPVLSAVLPAFYASSFPPALALFIAILQWQEGGATLLIYAFLIYVGLVIHTAINTNQILEQTLLLQTEKETLIGNLNNEIAERKGMQDQLESHKQNLEQTVHQRTQELSETNQSLEREINERIHSENQLREAHQFLQAIIDCIADPIMVIGLDYKIQLMNKAASGDFPIQEDVVSSLKCYQVSHDLDRPCTGDEHPCPLKMMSETQEAAKVLHYHKAPDGSERLYEIVGTPLFDEQGQLTGMVQASRDITSHIRTQQELQEKKDQLEHVAYHDALTGLPNRVLLADRLHQAMVLSQRRKTRLAVAYLDLDGFKDINDLYGHQVGDRMLVSLSQQMKMVLREGDTIARLGGDEFVSVMVDLTEIADSIPLIKRLQGAIAQPVVIDGLTLKVSASIGVTFYPQEGEVDADQLLRQADQAMYEAKISGRNCYHFFETAKDHRPN